MTQYWIAPLVHAKIDSFQNEKNESIKFCKVTVIDEDAVTDQERMQTFTVRMEEALKWGLDNPEKVKELIGQTLSFIGKTQSRYITERKEWVKNFKCTEIKVMK